MTKETETLINSIEDLQNISMRQFHAIGDLIEQVKNSVALTDVSNCKTEPKLGKLETELCKLQKVHGEIVKHFDVNSVCDSFKFKDGAVYRVKLERSFGKATLD